MSDDPVPAPPPLSSLNLAPGYRLGLVLDPDGTVRAVNEVVGIDNFVPEVFVGRHIGAASETGARGAARRLVWEQRVAAAQRQPEPLYYDDLRPDALEGAPAITTVTVTPVADADGSLHSILVAVHDRSEADEVARTAREQGELLRSALDVTRMGSFALYIRERRFDCDERYREIFGYDPGPAVAEHGVGVLTEPLHLDDRERVSKTFWAAMRGEAGVNYHEEYRIWAPTPGGAPVLRRISVLGRVEVDEQGPRRILGVVDDVTDRRREDELRIRMQKREALGTLAGGMAHDFNNVISAILSNASVAAAEVKAGADPSTSIEEIASGARRAGDLVSRMLDFSRDREPERRAVALADVTRDACRLMGPMLPPQVVLSIDAADGLPALRGDATQLQQVVMNLVTNAVQAMDGRPGAIQVTLDALTLTRDGSGSEATLRPGDYVRLRVNDDGHGIPEGNLNRIFDPFFTTKPQGEGTGLGLAAAQTIVRSHSGLITAESLPGDGTTVTVLLPCQTGDGGADATDEEPAEPRESAPATPGKPRVLFVDDEPALTMLAERALPHHGCEVSAFTEATEALDALRSAPDAFDALVTDLAMPVITGLELIAAAREVRPDLPVVLTSGFLTAESEAEARRLAVDQVVPKPCSIDQLAAAVLAFTRAG